MKFSRSPVNITRCDLKYGSLPPLLEPSTTDENDVVGLTVRFALVEWNRMQFWDVSYFLLSMLVCESPTQWEAYRGRIVCRSVALCHEGNKYVQPTGQR